MEEYRLERATRGQEETCWHVIQEGRAFQLEQGFVQWDAAYPTRDHAVGDVEAGSAWLLYHGSEVAGYVCIDPSGEPCYDHIEGGWNTGENYVVIRRIAFARAYAGRGLSSIMFRLIDEKCRALGYYDIRLNTSKENKRMQNAALGAGYSYCGIIIMRNKERLAYDKKLDA